VLDAATRLLHGLVGALDPQVALARVDLDVEILPQQLGVAIVRAEDQDRLVVRAQRDGGFRRIQGAKLRLAVWRR
jgi:hypothetical protein